MKILFCLMIALGSCVQLSGMKVTDLELQDLSKKEAPASSSSEPRIAGIAAAVSSATVKTETASKTAESAAANPTESSTSKKTKSTERKNVHFVTALEEIKGYGQKGKKAAEEFVVFLETDVELRRRVVEVNRFQINTEKLFSRYMQLFEDQPLYAVFSLFPPTAAEYQTAFKELKAYFASMKEHFTSDATKKRVLQLRFSQNEKQVMLAVLQNACTMIDTVYVSARDYEEILRNIKQIIANASTEIQKMAGPFLTSQVAAAQQNPADLEREVVQELGALEQAYHPSYLQDDRFPLYREGRELAELHVRQLKVSARGKTPFTDIPSVTNAAECVQQYLARCPPVRDAGVFKNQALKNYYRGILNGLAQFDINATFKEHKTSHYLATKILAIHIPFVRTAKCFLYSENLEKASQLAAKIMMCQFNQSM